MLCYTRKAFNTKIEHEFSNSTVNFSTASEFTCRYQGLRAAHIAGTPVSREINYKHEHCHAFYSKINSVHMFCTAFSGWTHSKSKPIFGTWWYAPIINRVLFVISLLQSGSSQSIFVTLFFAIYLAIYSIAIRRCSQKFVLIRQNLVHEWLNFIVTSGIWSYIVFRGLYTVYRGAWRQILIDFGHIQYKETRNTVNYTNASFPSAQLMTSHTLS